jgi:hypothetical protein
MGKSRKDRRPQASKRERDQVKVTRDWHGEDHALFERTQRLHALTTPYGSWDHRSYFEAVEREFH